jgi:plastocyanin
MRQRFTVAALSVAMLAGAACGPATAADPTPVQTWKITPASGAATRLPPTPPVETPTPGPVETPGSGTTVALVGVNSTFDVETLQAPAGSVTIEFDNRDSGVVHNVHVFRGDSARGESVGETELEPGPVRQELTMALDPGEYFYQCDAHPTTMQGELTVAQ